MSNDMRGNDARGPIDPNLPLQVELEPYEKGEPSLIITLDGERVLVRIVNHGAMNMPAHRHIKLNDVVSQAAWLIAMAEAGGLDNVFGRLMDELTAARAHVRARFEAKFPKTTKKE